MKGECISEFHEANKLHEKNSKKGFDICYVCSNDPNCTKHYLGKNIISEDIAWEYVNNMPKEHPDYFTMIYVVYFCDIHRKKSPVPEYRAKAFIY